MKTNRILLLAVIVATTLCAALVWSNVVATGRARELKAELDTKEAELQKLSTVDHRPAANSVDSGTAELLAERDAEYTQLRDDYDRLKHQLELAQVASMASAMPTSMPARPDFGQFSRRNMSNYLERIRQQDPERYKEITQRIQQRQQQAAQERDDQMAALAQRAQNAATPEEADVVAQISDTLNKINDLRQSRAAVADLPETEQQTQMQSINQQLRDAMQDLSQLRDQDRTIQYQKLADDLKLSDSDKQKLVSSIPQILKETQVSPGRGPGGPGGPGGGGPAPPPPSTSSSTGQ
jgi:hypothetical protein